LAIDSDYYEGIFNFMKGIFDVCGEYGLYVKAYGCCNIYSPQDFNTWHEGEGNGSQWKVVKTTRKVDGKGYTVNK